MFIRSLHPCLAHKSSLLASVSNRVSILTNPIKQRKCILVSGGASGLGEAVTRHFVAQGLDVVVFDIHSERLESLQKELGSSQAPQHGSVLAFKVDITDANAVQEALNSCFPLTTPKEEESPMSSVPHPRILTGLVNCAGICPAKKLYSSKSKSPVHPLDLFQRVLEVNTVGTFNLTRLGVQRMIEHPLQDAPTDSPRRLSRGVVVLTASIAADEGQVGQMAYAASKAAVQGMCLPLARELGSHRIRVMCVAPGVMHTPLMDGLPPAVQEQLSAHVPFPKRLGAPFEFAQLVHHIFENEYLNGTTIRLDGALRMPP